jgi:hypothetical protein
LLELLDVRLVHPCTPLHRIGRFSGGSHDVHYLTVVPPMARYE